MIKKDALISRNNNELQLDNGYKENGCQDAFAQLNQNAPACMRIIMHITRSLKSFHYHFSLSLNRHRGEE